MKATRRNKVLVNLKERKRFGDQLRSEEDDGLKRASRVAWRKELHTLTMAEHALNYSMKRRVHREQTMALCI